MGKSTTALILRMLLMLADEILERPHRVSRHGAKWNPLLAQARKRLSKLQLEGK